MRVVCDVLPRCTYEMILGNHFLIATRTLSKYKHCLTYCIFPIANMLCFNFLGGGHQYLLGFLGNNGGNACQRYPLAGWAALDTGAERNVIDERSENIKKGLYISFVSVSPAPFLVSLVVVGVCEPTC